MAEVIMPMNGKVIAVSAEISQAVQEDDESQGSAKKTGNGECAGEGVHEERKKNPARS